MSARSYVALLRGINVGGRNLVAMEDLRRAFDAEGFGDVRTYIQIGNVLFTSDAPRTSLASDIEAMLERQLGVPLVAFSARAPRCATSWRTPRPDSGTNLTATTPT